MYGGLTLLEVCDANPACSADLSALEAEFPGVSVLETTCLSECELCALLPYVMLDGDIVTAPSLTELLCTVRDRVSQQDAE